MAELDAAIATITRAMGVAHDGDVAALVAERAALRGELRDLQADVSNVVDLEAARRRRS